MSSSIPIFITARGHTKEVFAQNKEALKFSYLFIKRLNIFDQTFIISDNKKMLDYATKLGFINTIHHPCKDNQEIKYLEYIATYNYALNNDYYPDWIILLNINQIFKTTSLLANCINNIDDNYDVIASYTEISDRSHFFLNEKNDGIIPTIDNHEKLSSQHYRMNMIDAAIYAIKTTFAFSCMKYENPAQYFWEGKIKYFKNDSIYTDIYNIKDIEKYSYVGKYVNEVKRLPN